VIATARYPEKLKAEEVAAFMHIIPLMFPSAEDREALLRHAARATKAAKAPKALTHCKDVILPLRFCCWRASEQ